MQDVVVMVVFENVVMVVVGDVQVFGVDCQFLWEVQGLVWFWMQFVVVMWWC